MVRILVLRVMCTVDVWRSARGRCAGIVDDDQNSIGILRKGKSYVLRIVLEKEKNENEKRK